MGFLTDALDRTRRELDASRAGRSERRRHGDAHPTIRPPLDFARALQGPRARLIAEVKRASPSAGPIAQSDPAEQAERYERGGAAAISVLTEPHWFGGSLDDLSSARAASRLPILRKDFVVDPSQVLEARARGADAVLLIAAALTDRDLAELRGLIEEQGMAALVEAHGEPDMERALAHGGRLIGVNARDMETLEVDVERALALAGRVPSDRVLVVESGIFSRQDVVRAEEAGARAVLVGEALMRSPHPEATIRELLGLIGPPSEAS
jgi:indole-3-glycerol phosphate synthase